MGSIREELRLFPGASDLIPPDPAVHQEKRAGLMKNGFVLIWQNKEKLCSLALPAPGYSIPKPPAWICAIGAVFTLSLSGFRWCPSIHGSRIQPLALLMDSKAHSTNVKG